MINRSNLFKIMGSVIAIAVTGLIIINLLYIKEGNFSKNSAIVGISTIALLVWATALWLMVLWYSKKDKK